MPAYKVQSTGSNVPGWRRDADVRAVTLAHHVTLALLLCPVMQTLSLNS